MKQSWKSILRFLFPEMQIIDAVRQEGFIAKKQAHQNVRAAEKTVAGNVVLQKSAGASNAQPSFASADSVSAFKQKQVCKPGRPIGPDQCGRPYHSPQGGVQH